MKRSGCMVKRSLVCSLAALFVLFLSVPAFADILTPFRNNRNERIAREACAIAREAVTVYLKEHRIIPPPSKRSTVFRIPAGVFVTTVKNGAVRTCMGTVEPHESDAGREIIRSAIMSATRDPWHDSIDSHELPRIQYVISVVGNLKRIDSIRQLNPKKYGLLVRKGNRSALLLPGEALTTDWALFQCRKKAGIPQNQPVELFIFETVTYGPY